MKERIAGWIEEYRCGCVSAVVKDRKQLLGYCNKHGESSKRVYADIKMIKRKPKK